MGLGGVAIAALPSMIHPKLSFSDSLGGVNLFHHILNKSCRINLFKNLQILFILLSNYRLRCRAPAS